jgi:hypothetical protein
MSARPCPIALWECIGVDSPITGISSQDPDPVLFYSACRLFYDPYAPPPLGGGIVTAADYSCLVFAAETQALADQLASGNCSGQISQSDFVSVTVPCLTPGYTLTVTLPAGYLLGRLGETQEQVNARAEAIAMENALTRVAAGECDYQPLAIFIHEQQAPFADCGSAYFLDFHASGGLPPYTFSADSVLPTWLSLSATGELTGTPTAADLDTTSDVIIRVTDATGNHVTLSQMIHVNACPTVTITPSSIINGIVGEAYSDQVFATGFIGAYTWSWINNPPDLTLDPDTGMITGTPAGTGSYMATITVENTCGCGTSADFNIDIGTIGNIEVSTACPSDALIVSGTPENTYVSDDGGGPTDYNQTALNCLAYADAFNQLAGLGCSICNAQVVVFPRVNSGFGSTNLHGNTFTSTCPVPLYITGSGTYPFNIVNMTSDGDLYGFLWGIIGSAPAGQFLFTTGANGSGILLFTLYF